MSVLAIFSFTKTVNVRCVESKYKGTMLILWLNQSVSKQWCELMSNFSHYKVKGFKLAIGI